MPARSSCLGAKRKVPSTVDHGIADCRSAQSIRSSRSLSTGRDGARYSAPMFSFSGCTVDVEGRVLTRNGQVQHLEPQAFDVLVYLLENRDRVIPKRELLETVWGGQWVSESALTTRVKEIRRATGDTGDAQRVVRTVRGRGYQLVAAVTGDTAPESSPRRLVGRGRDLDELSQRVRPGALVTLVGPGGVGKTTLARTLVAESAGRFAEGAIIVDLTVLEEPSQLLGAVARAARAGDSSDNMLSSTLSGLDAVLLLDDADDLVPEVAQLCAELAQSGGRLAVIVTSRERLGSPRRADLARSSSVGSRSTRSAGSPGTRPRAARQPPRGCRS